MAATAAINFHINGIKHSIGNGNEKVSPKTVLADYIRDVANLKGTKVMCREGGCGACLVSAKVIDPNTGAEIIKSVNSCLTPVLSCDGWDISTVERLGNKKEGYHVVQNRLVNFHGTQCGYCTPGMVMNMYSMLESNHDLEMEDIEKNLDGNICRCTGYRPILDAFKSLTKDADEDLKRKCADIEDCATCPMKTKQGGCSGQQTKAKDSLSHFIKLSGGEDWVTAKNLEGALATAAAAATKNTSHSVRFVAGNTSTGIFKNEGQYKTFIDITGIPDLKKCAIEKDEMLIGGGTTLTEVIRLLKENSKIPGYEYGQRVASHLERVANVSVRNNGTIAGNLMIKHQHNEFPSDVFVILEAVGATITLVGSGKKCGIRGTTKIERAKSVSLLDFLKTDMTCKLILSLHLPKREDYHYRSFKITRRYQNAHAYVNAALLFKVNKYEGNFVVQERPRLVYGGISPEFIHANGAEVALQGKCLSDPRTLKLALQALDKEVKPEMAPLESAESYRIQLVKTLLYKTILEIIGSKVARKLQSGSGDILRKLIKGEQNYDTDNEASNTALYKAVPKYEGSIQASGEAEYTGDIPHHPDELFGVFVTSTVGNAELVDMDATEAMKIPGVVRLVTAKDIPGENNAMKFNFFPTVMAEPIFVTDKISYYGQALGMILATCKDTAAKAAKLVKVKYANEQKPVVNIDDAIENAKTNGSFPKQTGGKFETKPNGNLKVEHTLKGKLRMGSQYHFYMETQTVVCHPREDGIDVHLSTQWIDHAQNTIATALNIPTNSINMQCRRLGGGFGGKASRPTLIATACAVATWVSNRPVRVILDMETNMSMLGKRLPYRIPYEVGFDSTGKIGSLNIDLICDTGYAPNEPTTFLAMAHLQNVYKAAGWSVDTHFVTTNTPSNTACRAPGSVQSVAAIEWIMDHIATYLGKDPVEIREVNLLEKGDPLVFGAPTYERENLIPRMINEMKEGSEYGKRKQEIECFNLENRWKKQGISVVPVRYPIEYFAANMIASIAIYHLDGYISVSHGGVEMGQGLNTKVVQAVAQALNVPMDRIKIKPTNNFVAANSFATGGSIASEVVCYSVMRACEEIRENLRPVLEKLENPSWEKLIAEAHNAKVKLTASYTPTAKDDIKGYDVWVLNCTEVEIDVLTGEYKIVRTDLYEDTGKSLSPAIDLGQIEGGYIMGQGFWTTEKIVHDEQSGKLLTNGTWDYKAPEVKDIPEDFRITLLSNAPNPHGVLRSKATGEPSTDSAFAVVLALRNAIGSARMDAGNSEWFEISAPVTPEDVANLCLFTDSQLAI